jgi:hypothetical protein
VGECVGECYVVSCRCILIEYIYIIPQSTTTLCLVIAIERLAGNVARRGEERGVSRVLVGKLEGRRPLGRPRCRWVDNIRMALWDVGIWTGLGWLRIETGGGRL